MYGGSTSVLLLVMLGVAVLISLSMLPNLAYFLISTIVVWVLGIGIVLLSGWLARVIRTGRSR